MMADSRRSRWPRRRGSASRSRVPRREVRCPLALRQASERRDAPPLDAAGRAQRVERLRDAVLRGAYTVDPTELAEALLRGAADLLLQ